MFNLKISLFFLILLFTPLPITPKFIEENEKAQDTIYIKSSINEIFATTEVLQYFKNILDDTIELSVSFPIKGEISLSKFEITIGDRKVTSIIMEKEKLKKNTKKLFPKEISALYQNTPMNQVIILLK